MSRASHVAPVTVSVPLANLCTLSSEAFHRSFGSGDFRRAITGFTPAVDTAVVLTLLAHARPLRILEIGTAAGHMTANLTEWSAEDAQVFSLGAVRDLNLPTQPGQRYEDPPRAAFARQANHFGKVYKVFFITGDSLTYDFGRLAPLDFVFIDGAHDEPHVRSDSLKAYAVLRPGGLLVWHDFNSRTSWVEVRQALAGIAFAEPLYHVVGTEVAFLRKQEVPVAGSSMVKVTNREGEAPAEPAAAARQEPRPPDRCIGQAGRSSAPLSLVWEGPQQRLHSLALVNRAFCQGLLEHGHAVSIVPEEVGEPNGTISPLLMQHFHRALERPADVTVRQAWPPDFTPPPHGHWVIMQPWEFGSLPAAWIPPLSEEVDEIWANSRYVQDVYVRSGVPADRVHVVPLGVDIATFHPEVPPFALNTGKRFKFLFVGGTIFRKGIDVLLDAYAATFRREDDVCLVIKDMGVGTFYQGQTCEGRIAELQAQTDAPEIEYCQRPLTAEEMAGLYRACDCLVHPYRGEGFGLPIAEAMACGLPALVTGMGAALDFCNDANAFLIPAERRSFSHPQVGGLATVDLPWLAEPDGAALCDLLRHAVSHPDELRAKGDLACAHIRAHFTWDHAVAAAEKRLRALQQLPIRRHSRSRPRPCATVSLCMIVKNAESCLPRCLAAVSDLVTQMVVVDTGSTDRTREVAQQLGAQVVDFAWVDSFAAARNESLRHATGEWILWLDADESFDAANRERLQRLLANLPAENVTFLMCQVSELEHGPHTAAKVDHPRLFRNQGELRWTHRVHEQILPSLRQLGAAVRPTDIVITHDGYADPRTQRPKVQRNRRLLEMELRENPTDAFVLYNLGALALTDGRPDDALEFLSRSLGQTRPADTLFPKLHALMVRAHHHKGQPREALAACRSARAQPALAQDAELLFWEGVLSRDLGEPATAETCWLQVLQSKLGPHFTSTDAGLKSYRTRQALAELYGAQERWAEAEAQWRLVVAECPRFLDAWLNLAEMYFTQARWPDLLTTCGELETIAHAPVEAAVLRARVHLAHKEFATARHLLQTTIAAHPRELWPRAILSHVLLQEGKDWPAAERALRDILALDPAHREAQRNLALLLQKHGNGKTAAPAVGADVAPNAVAYGPRPTGSATVSLCMIVKDEEANLEACLASAAGLCDEIVVVDTGSTDRTREIARACGARVFDFPWVDSFAAARNESLRHATGQWVFWLDADDRLDEENREKLRALFARLPAEGMVAYVMKCVCLPNPSHPTSTVVDHLRLFRNHSDLRWTHRVHEQILPAVRRLVGEVRLTEIRIQHVGYQDPPLRRRKLERDLRLLRLEEAEQPEHPFTLFNLGCIQQELGDVEPAITCFQRSLEHSHPSDSIVRKLYALLAQCHRHLGRKAEALAACQQGRVHYPEDPELLFREGLVRLDLADLPGAAACLEQLLGLPAGTYLASLDSGIRGHLAHFNLAEVYRAQGRLAEAETQLQATLQAQPDYPPALHALGKMYVGQERWPELEPIAARLDTLPTTTGEGAVFRARGHLARSEFAAARAMLEATIARFPTALPPHVILSHVLLQEGRDRDAAERALRAVLALDPDNAEAARNLSLLVQRQREQGA